MQSNSLRLMDSTCMANYYWKVLPFGNNNTFAFIQREPLCSSNNWYTFLLQPLTKLSNFQRVACFWVIKLQLNYTTKKRFVLVSKCLSLPIQPLINLPETLILSV